MSTDAVTPAGSTPAATTPAATTDLEAVPDYRAALGLPGRGFVVLGAGQGIGRQAVHALVQAGARVVAVDAEASRAEAVAAELPGHVVPHACDITDRASMRALADTAVAELGRLDGVVDIVGVAHYGSIFELEDEQWERSQDLVLRHAWLALRELGPRVAAGGSISFVASVSGLASAPQHAAYGAYKAALLSLVRTAAVELGPSTVRVNAVVPGVVRTPRMMTHLGEEGLARLTRRIPVGRVCLPSDIAAALLFLAGDLASVITGQALVVDGGATVTSPFERS